MKKYTNLADKHPMYQGGFIWDYIDQGLMKTDRYGQEFIAFGADYGDQTTVISVSMELYEPTVSFRLKNTRSSLSLPRY